MKCCTIEEGREEGREVGEGGYCLTYIFAKGIYLKLQIRVSILPLFDGCCFKASHTLQGKKGASKSVCLSVP